MDTNQKQPKFVLFVGEGDFSYSASYVEKQNSKNELVFSTCLNSGILNSKQNKNIEIIKDNGGSVLTDVDATQLESHPVLSQVKFRKIIFNFPHVPKKMNIGQNRKLVELFLKSAEQILDSNGRIHVSLCKGQGGTDAEVEVREWHNSWQIVELASRAGLMLCDIWPFDVDSFEKYECTGFRGQSKSFNMEAAVTHVFCRQRLVSSGKFVSQKFSEDSLKEWFKSDCTELYRSLSQKLDSPFSGIAAVLIESVKSKIILNNDSYFTVEYFKDKLLPMYRSLSLFPASHTHDTSFWVNEDFKERNLFVLVRRTVGLLVKSIKLVEIYCDEPTKRVSRCYRFVYQSHGEILPKSVVSCIHSQLRLTIEMSLNVSLR
ncbi:hypothetical protein JTE90_010787 [Oedothorax gibbosus]|uniref:FDX-ACB domain-containing protein n=1 Tax=Oedothorax gibbosus TaxID=931172 RepID=A0AAV6VIG0_9ARAC|nr:hypothetical protein JTE90_010787 [Oedothorax gibbosus]